MARPDITKIATAESRRKGALAANKARTENAKTVRQRFAERVQQDADELYESFKRGWSGDDWRAAQAAIAEAHGKPTERTEHSGPDGAAIPIEDRSAKLAEVAAILRAAGQLDERDAV